MATVSFDEKIVISDPEIIAKIKADLSTPSSEKRNKQINCTSKSTEENAKKWVSKFLRSAK